MTMEKLTSGVSAMRPALPAKSYAESKRFYEVLGFETRVITPALAEVKLAAFSFLLQDFYVADFAKNFVMHMNVDDANAWWAHIEPLALEKTFAVRAPIAPALKSWGLNVLSLFDPAGVLWQISSRP